MVLLDYWHVTGSSNSLSLPLCVPDFHKLFFIAGVTLLLSHIPFSYTVIATPENFINANNGYKINTCFAHVDSNATQNDLLSQAITHMCDFQFLFSTT